MEQFLIRRISTQAIEYVIRVSVADPDAIGPFDLDNPPPAVEPIVEHGCEAISYEGDTSILGRQPTPTSALEWLGGPEPVWVERGDMPAQRAHRAEIISSCCADAILAGFVSSALGAPFTYPAKLTDQANLSGSVLASILPSAGPDWVTPFWCADTSGTWEFRLHTAAQIQQVGVDAKGAILAHMTTNERLQAQIVAAQSPSQLAPIHWPE